MGERQDTRQPVTTDDELKKRVALAYCQGLTQEEIADYLGIGQSTVSKLLDGAKNWIVRQPRFIGPLTREEELRLSVHTPSQQLPALLKEAKDREGWTGIPKVYSFYAGPSVTMAEWDRSVIRWGHNAAPTLVGLLDHAGSIGVALGRTMRAVVDALTAFRVRTRGPRHRSKRSNEPKSVFPLRGPRLVMWREEDDEVFTDPHRLTANSLASDVNRLFHSHSELKYATTRHLTVPELIGFSERFPFDLGSRTARDRVKLLQQEQEFVRDFIRSCSVTEANGTIFGGAELHGGFCDQADALLVPVARSGTSRSFAPFVESFAGIPLRWLEENTLGDIGTVLLPSDGCESRESDRKQLERIRYRQPGLKVEHLKKCAERAWGHNASPKLVGVIACVVGRRAETVLYCLRLGLINHLFLDYECAERLYHLLGGGAID